MKRGGEVTAKEGSFVDLIIHIANNNVALNQGVNNPLIIVTLEAVLCAAIKLNFVKIRAGRRVSAGHSTADELSAVVMECVQRRKSAANELMLIAEHENRLPNLLQSHTVKSIKVLILNLWATVGESFTFPQRSQSYYFFSIIKIHFI